MFLQKFSNASSITRSKIISILMVFSLAFFTGACGGGDDGRNMKIPGVAGPTLTLHNDSILIAFVFENIHIPAGLRYKIPKYPNSYIEVSPDFETGGTLVAFNVDLDDVFGDHLQDLDPMALPGGRPLPGVPSGRLPAVAFSIPEFHGVSLYLGPKLFGVFVPIKGVALGGTVVSSKFYTSSTKVGTISLVSEDDYGENGGVLLMLDMSKSTKKKLEKISKQY